LRDVRSHRFVPNESLEVIIDFVFTDCHTIDVLFAVMVGLAPTTCGLVPAALPLLSYMTPILFYTPTRPRQPVGKHPR
jgi:hypothetical protein